MTEPSKPRALIAHEINNPLATVITNLDLIGRQIAVIAAEPDLRDRLKDVIEEVRDATASAYRMREIVRDLLPPTPADDDPRALSSAGAAHPLRRGKVLVIDDEPMVARSLGRVLEPEHDVTIVLDAGDAHRRVLAG